MQCGLMHQNESTPITINEAAYTEAPVCDAYWSVCDSFRVWQCVKLTLAGLWHTPAASLGSQLCDTGLLVPVRAGCVLVGGAGRWLVGEGAGHNVEHWAKAEYFRYKMAPKSLRMYWNVSSLTWVHRGVCTGHICWCDQHNTLQTQLTPPSPTLVEAPPSPAGGSNEWCLCCDRCNTFCLESSNQQSSQEEEPPPPHSWSLDYPPTLLAHGRLLGKHRQREALQICMQEVFLCVLEWDFVFIFNLNTKEVEWNEREMGRKQVTAAGSKI